VRAFEFVEKIYLSLQLSPSSGTW